MAATLFRAIFNNNIACSNFLQNYNSKLRCLHTSDSWYAARKGTRAKARAKKVKVEIQKVGFIPHNLRKKKAEKVVNKRIDDSYKKLPIDDVYITKFFRWPVYTTEEAVEAHKQTHHPTVYNAQDSFIYAHVETNMVAAKKTRFVDSFTRLVALPHFFPQDVERSILAFCKDPAMVKEALEAGATTAGGLDVIKKIQEGSIKLADHEFILAHPNIITDLVPIRGLMKRKFPNVRMGTLHPNLPELIKKFATGVQFRVLKDETQQDFGSADIPVGKIYMETQHIVENIDAVLKNIQSVRPKRDGLFITKCYLKSPPSHEILIINPFAHVDEFLSQEVQEESDDEDDVAIAQV